MNKKDKNKKSSVSKDKNNINTYLKVWHNNLHYLKSFK
jgi:hypothetical protein